MDIEGNRQQARPNETKEVTDRITTAGIPERYRDITFDEIRRRGLPRDVNWAKSFGQVENYANHLGTRVKEGDGMIMFGNNGNLKTSLAVAVLRQHIDGGGHGRFMPMCTMAHKLRSMWAINPHEANVYHDKLATTPLLVIDDLGAEDSQKDWVMTEIESIIAERYNNKRSTIITTNLGRRDLVKSYSMRIMDRLRESAITIEFKGNSVRKNLTLSEELNRYHIVEEPVAQMDLEMPEDL